MKLKEAIKKRETLYDFLYFIKFGTKKIIYKFPKKRVLLWEYKKHTRKSLNLIEPKTFDEKIQWIKLHGINSEIIKAADKYEVTNFLKDNDLPVLTNKLYGVYSNADEINWEDLPKKFVLKTTNGCKTNIIVRDKDKLDRIKAIRKLNYWMKIDYGVMSMEPQYSMMQPKIICEQFLEDKQGKFPNDYKFFCFNGEVKFISVIYDRNEDMTFSRHFLDLNWNKLDFTTEKNNDSIPQKPDNLEEMISIATKLSKKFLFVRVDLYDLDGPIILGEMTFTPSSGMATYLTDEAQIKIGNMLKLK